MSVCVLDMLGEW